MNKKTDIENTENIDETTYSDYKSYSGQAFLNDLTETLNKVTDAGAKYARCLFLNKGNADLCNITDIQVTTSIFKKDAPATRVCIVFDKANDKPVETIENFAKVLTGITNTIEENDIAKVEVTFARGSINGNTFRTFRYYFDDANDTVLLGVNGPTIKNMAAFAEAHPEYGTTKVINKITDDDIEAAMQKDIDAERR